MSNNDEHYTPSLEDEALQASLLTVGVMGAIQQAYADGKMDKETYTSLFNKAREADAQVRYLLRMIEAQERSKQ